MTAIIIRTAGRPTGVDYLPALLEACDAEKRAGYIVADGSAEPIVPLRWTVVPTGGFLGSRLAGWRALQLARDLGGDVLLLEDDARPVPGALATMLHKEIPPMVPLVSFFSHQRHAGGLSMLPTQRLANSVALKISGEAIYELPLVPPETPGMIPRHSFDVALGAACLEMGWRWYGQWSPSLVEHVGDVSSVSGRRRRKRAAWLEGSEPPARSR